MSENPYQSPRAVDLPASEDEFWDGLRHAMSAFVMVLAVGGVIFWVAVFMGAF